MVTPVQTPERNYRAWVITVAVIITAHIALYVNAQVHRKEFYRRLNEKIRQNPIPTATKTSAVTPDQTLHIGDSMPESVSTLLNHLPDAATQRQKYTLLVVVSPTCPACGHLWSALSKNYATLAPFVRIVAVAQAEKETGWFAHDEQMPKLPFPVVADSSKAVGRALGLSDLVPYWTLFSPQNRLLIQGDGFGKSADTGSELTDALVARFANRATETMPLTRWKQTLPTEVGLVRVNSKNVNVRDLSADHLVVITFLNNGGFTEAKRVRQLQDMARVSDAKYLFVSDDPTRRFFDIKTSGNLLVAEGDTKPAFQRLGIGKGPVTVLYYRGRTFAMEAGAQPSDFFMRIVRYSDLIAGSPALRNGFPQTVQTSRNTMAKETKLF